MCENGGMSPSSARAFEDALSPLNRFNLTDVWQFCSLLSMADLFGSEDETPSGRRALFPALNSEQIRLFASAVLYSRAADYKTPAQPFRIKQYAQVHNALSDAVGISADLPPNLTPEEAAVQFFGPLLNRQVQAQTANDILFHLARSYALMVDLPRTHRADIERSIGRAGASFDMDTALSAAYGLDLERFLHLAFGVMALYRQRNGNVGMSPPAKRLASAGASAWSVLEAYLVETERRRAEVTFTAADLAIVGTAVEVEGFLRLTAATTMQLRDALTLPAYQVGGAGLRLSPLERYPIVDLGEGRYVVPDLATYGAVIANVPYLSMLDGEQAQEREAYRNQQGAAQELYLQDLVQARLPAIEVIQERIYSMGKNSWKGPDLTLIEPDGNVVLVESKARRIQPATRVAPGGEELIRNLDGALSALRLLETKWAHLRQGAGGQTAVAEPPEPPIAVAVIGETHLLANQKVRQYLRGTPQHPLHALTLPYLILSVEEFEMFVEVAATNNLSLHGLLKQQVAHVQAGPVTELWALNGHRMSRSASFLNGFVDRVYGPWIP